MPAAEANGDRFYEGVDTRLVSTATELWSAIEVAQYAHLLVHDEPQADRDARALRAFVDAFNEWIERWDETAFQNKAPVLQAIDGHLKALAALGFFVHWGCAERVLASSEGEGSTVPVAIVTIDRNRSLITRVGVPTTMDVSLEEQDGEG